MSAPICRDCKHNVQLGFQNPRCAVGERDVVYGAMPMCHMERVSTTCCGPDGKNFEPKPPAGPWWKFWRKA